MIEKVKDIPDDFILVNDSQDIEAVLDYTGMWKLRDKIGCMFVSMRDGEYKAVYYSERIIPWLFDEVYEIPLTD